MKFPIDRNQLSEITLVERTMTNYSTLAKLLVVVVPLLFSEPTVAGPKAGPVTTGGGNSISGRIIALQKMFGADDDGTTDKTMNKVILEMAKTLKQFPPEQTPAMKDVATMIAGGLEKDIMESRYVLSSYCSVVDERTGKEIEKAASTQKINLIENPDQASPDICINVQELAANNSSEDEIKGLLFHEHARHFGLEDTTKLKVNPIAVEITEMALKIQRTLSAWQSYYSSVGDSGTKISYSSGGKNTENKDTADILYLTTLSPEKVSFNLSNFEGKCNKSSIVIKKQNIYKSADSMSDTNYFQSVTTTNRNVVNDIEKNKNISVQLNEEEALVSYNSLEASYHYVDGNIINYDNSVWPLTIEFYAWKQRKATGLERLKNKEIYEDVKCMATLDVKLDDLVLDTLKIKVEMASSKLHVILRGTKPFTYSYK